MAHSDGTMTEEELKRSYVKDHIKLGWLPEDDIVREQFQQASMDPRKVQNIIDKVNQDPLGLTRERMFYNELLECEDWKSIKLRELYTELMDISPGPHAAPIMAPPIYGVNALPDTGGYISPTTSSVVVHVDSPLTSKFPDIAIPMNGSENSPYFSPEYGLRNTATWDFAYGPAPSCVPDDIPEQTPGDPPKDIADQSLDTDPDPMEWLFNDDVLEYTVCEDAPEADSVPAPENPPPLHEGLMPNGSSPPNPQENVAVSEPARISESNIEEGSTPKPESALGSKDTVVPVVVRTPGHKKNGITKPGRKNKLVGRSPYNLRSMKLAVP
ncbi:hypothetical protein F5B19DRAFT_490308 [Rostrohypoxylon terebratum]|nr:hypothetical protein F5B19DRAFT_490308 [Rostrohypoxylon terebratum]